MGNPNRIKNGGNVSTFTIWRWSFRKGLQKAFWISSVHFKEQHGAWLKTAIWPRSMVIQRLMIWWRLWTKLFSMMPVSACHRILMDTFHICLESQAKLFLASSPTMMRNWGRLKSTASRFQMKFQVGFKANVTREQRQRVVTQAPQAGKASCPREPLPDPWARPQSRGQSSWPTPGSGRLFRRGAYAAEDDEYDEGDDDEGYDAYYEYDDMDDGVTYDESWLKSHSSMPMRRTMKLLMPVKVNGLTMTLRPMMKPLRPTLMRGGGFRNLKLPRGFYPVVVLADQSPTHAVPQLPHWPWQAIWRWKAKEQGVARARAWSSTHVCLGKLLILVAVQLPPCNVCVVERKVTKLPTALTRNTLLLHRIHLAPRGSTRLKAWLWPLLPLFLKNVVLWFLKMNLVVSVWTARC